MLLVAAGGNHPTTINALNKDLLRISHTLVKMMRFRDKSFVSIFLLVMMLICILSLVENKQQETLGK